MGRFRFHEIDDLMQLRASVYRQLVRYERLGYPMLAGVNRRTLERIDRELRRRKHPATPAADRFTAAQFTPEPTGGEL